MDAINKYFRFIRKKSMKEEKPDLITLSIFDLYLVNNNQFFSK